MTAVTVIDNIINRLGEAFKEAGYELYLVGGSVRDALIGIDFHDLDFATNARPPAIKDILNGMGAEVTGQPKVEALWGVGEKFGTIGAIVSGMQVEITTYRSEKYRNTRQPEVEFGDSIEEDLSRRDFTMNAIAMNTQAPDRYTLVDPFHGQQDIRAGVVRFVGHPKARIMEDALRMLRAVRFEATLKFDLAPETRFWVTSQSYMIQRISWERVQEELNKMLLSNAPSYCIRRLDDVGLLWEILPEIAKLKSVPQDSRWHFGNVYVHTLEVLDNSLPVLEQRIAALFHDCGKARTFWKESMPDGTERISFHGHENVGAKVTSEAMRRLKYSNGIRGKVIHLVKMHMRPLSLVNSGMSKKAVRKFIRDCYDNKYGVSVWDVLDLNRADILGHKHPQMDGYNALHDAVNEEQSQAIPVQELQSPLDGSELLDMFSEWKPGPWVGIMKRHLTEQVICGNLAPNDKEGARDIVMRQNVVGELK